MNFALARLPARHPAGLAAVVGLHVLLAAGLLAANTLVRLHVREAPATIIVDDSPPPPPRPAEPLPLPAAPILRTIVVPTPEIPVEPPAPSQAVQGTAEAQPGEAVAAGPGREAGAQARPSSPARPARIDAGASQCRPEYPASAQRAGATGVTRIRFTVDAAGVVTGAEILQRSGPTREHRLLDRAAAEALQHCPILPGVDENGRAVGTSTDVEYTWTLD
jgi:protein TonB